MKRLLLLFTFAGLSAQETPKKGLLTDLTPKKDVFNTTDPKLAEFKRKIEEEKKAIQAKLIEKVPFWLDLPNELKNTVTTYVLLDYLKKIEELKSAISIEYFIIYVQVVLDFIKQHGDAINWKLLIDEMFTMPFLWKVPYDQKHIYEQLAQQFNPGYPDIYKYFSKKIKSAYTVSIQYAQFIIYGKQYYILNRYYIDSSPDSPAAQHFNKLKERGKLKYWQPLFISLDIPDLGILVEQDGNLNFYKNRHGHIPPSPNACTLL